MFNGVIPFLFYPVRKLHIRSRVLSTCNWDEGNFFTGADTGFNASCESSHKKTKGLLTGKRQTNDFHDFTRLRGKDRLNHAEMGGKTQWGLATFSQGKVKAHPQSLKRFLFYNFIIIYQFELKRKKTITSPITSIQKRGWYNQPLSPRSRLEGETKTSSPRFVFQCFSLPVLNSS